MEIEKANIIFDSLYGPGDYFRTLDTKLCVAVVNLVKDSNSLKSEIDIEAETLARQGKRIAGRQVLLMVYKSYKTHVENGTVYDVMDVLFEPMPEKTKKAFFISEARNCPALQREHLDWKRKLDDDPTKTLET